jgi:hypothetical protein
MFSNRVKVVGFRREKKEEAPTPKSQDSNFAVQKKSVVIEERNLAALFRRDDDFRGLSVQISNTTDALTPGLIFSDLSII